MNKQVNERLYGQKGFGIQVKPPSMGALRDLYGFSPFSIWNTRENFWQERKRLWLRTCQIKSEEGRDDALTYNIPLTLSDGQPGRKIEAQTSIFDPVLTELAYSWWAPPGGIILDPFAGGSVRGIVASVLGYKYWGGELSAVQVAANKAQIGPHNTGIFKPKWVCGDSFDTMPQAPEADMVFSCPPYGDLEVYSDDPRDISNKTYENFLSRYGGIIYKTCLRLKDDSYAVWVVANFRNKETGAMRNFVGDTIGCFERAGLEYYNDIVLVNACGTAPMRANTSFLRGHRKVVKTHQNVLVFIKGDPEKASKKIGFDKIKTEE